MTRQITPAILARALEQEQRGDPAPARSTLREILSKLASKGVEFTVLERRVSRTL
jgi:hypothetical protein